MRIEQCQNGSTFEENRTMKEIYFKQTYLVEFRNKSVLCANISGVGNLYWECNRLVIANSPKVELHCVQSNCW